ncbi:hypothetical protein BPORC_1743 [Bifidobacterium porcinum]|nr:hypothetical protein BPORC_1743 [Bifidobacterium porcinum]
MLPRVQERGSVIAREADFSVESGGWPGGPLQAGFSRPETVAPRVQCGAYPLSAFNLHLTRSTSSAALCRFMGVRRLSRQSVLIFLARRPTPGVYACSSISTLFSRIGVGLLA